MTLGGRQQHHVVSGGERDHDLGAERGGSPNGDFGVREQRDDVHVGDGAAVRTREHHYSFDDRSGVPVLRSVPVGATGDADVPVWVGELADDVHVGCCEPFCRSWGADDQVDEQVRRSVSRCRSRCSPKHRRSWRGSARPTRCTRRGTFGSRGRRPRLSGREPVSSS